jgi:uncharacterized membrane protein
MAEAAPVLAESGPLVRRTQLDQPWSWLAAGWRDMRRSPGVSYTYGVLAAVTGYLLTLGLWFSGQVYLILPLVSAFLIAGPILAVGLYEASRRNETGQHTSLAEALGAFRRNASQIGLMGVVLLVLALLWMRLAGVVFMLYWGLEPPSYDNLIAATFLTPDALPFLVAGTLIGGVLALLAFSISVVAIPLLLDDQEANVIDAIATSIRAVQANPGPLLFWALLILVFVAAGLATLYLGLIVALPLVGHASWHAYRDLVSPRHINL